ncbi:Fumarate reductase/succinate dehydrogenase flavoprotein [Cordyceps militaris CM01]|uniref:Cholesterol oxidase n=1 Tax=Cordyceps militaris (strain CM01) TaxID=983644 RepID=G3JKD6_CORMM|nr:Fumarate reductase/succinate dehydrogenase flavoprotein [Cordyceps militaris CM01]EGX92214.1 Fumarate reductase/succinate dehydrogenase flavoprotein [Cordyceps militaris CM01]
MFPKSSRGRHERPSSLKEGRTTQDGTAAAPPASPFPRLAKSLDHLRPSYDCVVIGSGYGGGVAASRMARGGQSVCVLERGGEKWPGEYPTGLRQAARQVHVSAGRAGACGNAMGMFHIVAGKGQSAVVANGLGGGSLINANVFLEADESTLSSELWPSEIRQDPAYYQRVREVLEPEPYPQSWPVLDKTVRLQQLAQALGLADRFYRVPQTTRFRPGSNSVGVSMAPSTLSGQDATGINDGSKTTTLVTYLADAWHWGADLFCACEVRYIEKAAAELGGYLVYFATHDRARAAFPKDRYAELSWVHAKKAVFLGAGSLGTTEILLRSRAMGLAVSDLVGQGMSGNGDMLAFGYNTNRGALASTNRKQTFTDREGPAITSTIDMRDKTGNPLDGYVIQDGAVPTVLSTFVNTVVGSQATVRLEDDKPVLEFLGAGHNEERVERIMAPLRKVIEEEGGTLVYNPLLRLWGNHQITVHPLGGASMSRDNSGKSGVTNHVGEVFAGQQSETHAGLIVVDGAAIPAALGVNPSATIAALAERSVAAFAKRQSLTISTKSNGTINLDAPAFAHKLGREPTQPSTQTLKRLVNPISFTELLEGYLYSDTAIKLCNRASYERAYRMASGRGQVARLLASIQLERTTPRPKETCYKGTVSGTLVCPTIQGSPFMLHGGTIDLFQPDLDRCGTSKLVYDSPMTGTNGRSLHLHGVKILDASVSLSPRKLWRAMTSLLVTIADNSGSDTVAAGILKVKPGPFLKQLRTLTATGQDRAERCRRVMQLSSHFVRQMAPHFFLPLGPLEYAATPPLGDFTNPTEPTATYQIVAQDGVQTRLLMWEPDPAHVARDVLGTPVPTENLFMIPGAGVDHQIFALPTIATNAVNYFTRAGYRVFVLVHRIGRLEHADPSNEWTTYDARLDIRAGLEKTRQLQGSGKLYTIAHCMGSVAFSCGLLDGTVPADWIRGITCSQVFMHPVWGGSNRRKAALPVSLDRLHAATLGPWFRCAASPSAGGGARQALVDQLLRFAGSERCASASCHRVGFLFGRCWNHANLNEATHRHVDAFFGGASMALMQLLVRMGRRGRVTTNGPAFAPLDTDPNVQRLRGIPIFLFSGAESDVLSPEATEKTYERLCTTFGLAAPPGAPRPGLQYRRRVVQGYGHLDCWMGRDAYRDVYPMVLDEVDRVVRGEEWSALVRG